ncbi:MAG: hypothetical protein HZB82_08285 [Deltaproteobacteria bacterium]|nr:hypothetical protein [Deltaproteobacteria bacterium]
MAFPLNSPAEVMTVRAEGQAVKYDEAADVKKLAIEDALQKAAREVFAAVIKGERAAVQPSEYPGLYSSLTDYVLTYKILSEGWLVPEAPPLPKEPALPPGPPGPEAAPVIETYQVKLEASIDMDQMKTALARAIASKGTAGLNAYTLVMLDIPGYDAYRSLMETFSRIPTVKDVSYASFSSSRYVFTVKSTDTQAALVERLGAEAGDDYSVFAADAQTIAIKYFAPLEGVQPQKE